MKSRESSEGLVPSSEVMRMVEGKHLESTTSLFESIKVLLEASVSIDAEKNPKLPSVYSRFISLKELYEDHVARESRLVFPVFRVRDLKKLAGSVSRKDLLLQLDHLQKDHREIRKMMAAIRKASGDFQPDLSSSPSLKLCYAQFFQLEQELNTHFFLEEEALFPKMSEELKKLPGT